MVLVDPLPGRDLVVKEALRIPNHWIKLMRCMGECNGYYSLHAVPTLHVREFEEYIEHFVPLELACTSSVYWLEHQYTFLPNFEYYGLARRLWNLPRAACANQLANVSCLPAMERP